MIYNFKNLIGNVNTIQLITNSLKNGSFPNVAIYAGTMGTGKSSSAKATALALTCDSNTDALKVTEGCGCCSNCKAVIDSYSSTGESPYVKIVNAGEFASIDDVKSFIRSVFVFQNGNRNKVFILEEAHALRNIKGAQTALLEEIDRIPKNVYLIMCTTEEEQIKKELRSRAIVFQFQRLNKQDSSLLLDTLLSSKGGFDKFDKDSKKLIIKHSQGIPRNMENAIDFLLNSDASSDEIKEFMQAISDQSFIELFSSMKSNDVSVFVQNVDYLCNSRSVNTIVSELKRFIIEVMFFFEGGINDNFSKEERNELREIFSGSDQVLKIVAEVDRWQTGSDENSLKLHLFRLRLLLQQRKPSDVGFERNRVANLEIRQGSVNSSVLQEVEEQQFANGIKRVNSPKLEKSGAF